MKKTALVLPAFLLASGLAFAQSGHDDMSAFKGAYKEYQAVEEKKAQDLEKARARAQAQAQQQARIRERAEAQARLERKQQADRILARDQAYEDEMRRLDIQERKAAVASRRAQSSRSNDYIDQDLKRQGAVTDVVQSRADANRNLSVGARDMMQGVGKGTAK